MQNLRAFGFILLSLIFLVVPASAKSDEIAKDSKDTLRAETAAQQQLVESVDIQGNRRLKDEDLLYYIKTRPGDVFNQAQLERDLQELLSLNFFDKVESRVSTSPGVRGGVDVIFEVKELPIIRDLQFEGLKAVPESDVLKAFREQRVGISKESVYNPVNAQKGIRVIRELLASKGYPNAKVTVKEDEVSAISTAITFDVDQGNRSRIVDIEFEGNEVFSDGELRRQLKLVQETGLISRFQGQDILDLRKLEYDLNKNVRSYMFSKGYFQARIGEPQVVGLGYKRTGIPILGTLPLPLISSKDDTLKIIIPVTEGKIFRVGELKVEGNSIFSEQQILSGVGLKTGDIANGKRLIDAVNEDLKRAYGSQGFVLYNAEFDPVFKDNPNNPKEGIVDITITIDEGKQFRLRRLEFTGNTFTRDRVLRREFLINEGDIYNQAALETSVLRINQTQYFDPVDKDQDVEIRTDEEQGDVDLIVKVREKGRQQISFNGGISGIGGTFFGLEYSTNNLLGRGEVLSFQFGLGNVQQSFQFSFQEPYFRDRPISVGFTLFASRYKYFGEGTFLSQNQDLFNDALNPSGALITEDSNLFTQSTYGASVFATAPLSEFLPKRRFSRLSRIGLTYQFSATSIKEPEANSSNDPTRFIPVLFSQPNIITSRVTPTFVYDSREPSANGIDTLRGRQITASFSLAGLGGDVRTYQPTVSYTQFIPVRRKKSNNAEVFGFRLLAGTIGSFATTDKIRNANSLAFIGGVPYYERYRLGSEYDIRGYDRRSIGPLAPLDRFITSRNVVVASNINGTPTPISGLNSDLVNELAQFGAFTGAGGANPAFISTTYQIIPGDTQLLGNFEYRIPVFGPVSLAAFADVGTAFNLRKTGSENINSNFLSDDLLIGAGTLNQLFLRNNPRLEGSFGFPVLFNDHVLTTDEFIRNFCRGNRFGCPVSLPQGLQAFNLRGEAQNNTVLRVNDSLFDSIGDFRTSVGMELRVQVPVVNVPFRLIYYYNPTAKIGAIEGAPGVFLPEKRSGFRFTVGRTF
ncbi:MAG: outer membrane protein assembly factor BamA [Acidobacteria bacterium]|jgi:outer membrane protein insertion porin family|nr:outer membrane protein assembly factor BamA [Acidobacteriota bacterium]